MVADKFDRNLVIIWFHLKSILDILLFINSLGHITEWVYLFLWFHQIFNLRIDFFMHLVEKKNPSTSHQHSTAIKNTISCMWTFIFYFSFLSLFLFSSLVCLFELSLCMWHAIWSISRYKLRITISDTQNIK